VGAKGSGVQMLSIKELPVIELDNLGDEVDTLLRDGKIKFKALEEAPKLLQLFSSIYCEPYIGFKDTIYVPIGHIEAAQSKEPNQRIIATSKLLPWVYAIKNGSVSSYLNFLRSMINASIRSYYFLFEFSLLKAHEIPTETADLVAVGFISTRRNMLGFKRNPDKLLKILKSLLQSKIAIKPSV
jgi:hypothetical protein